MKAAYIKQNGAMEVVEIGDLPNPEPGPGQVQVALKAAALNHLDIWVRKGRPGMEPPFPHVLGSDGAGVVQALGDGVSNCTVGDEVIFDPGLSCGTCEWCLRGEQSECADFTLIGAGAPGTFAEQVVVPAKNIHPKPAHLSWEEAAALPLAHLTAWRMLFSRAQLRAGESVLIHGIGGGVALAAVQLASKAGARVIATSSCDVKLGKALELGADTSINYSTTPKVARQVLDTTGGRGVDVIIDTVGAGTWPINFEAARKGGRIVHCGITTGPTVECNLSLLYWKQLSILGSTMGSSEEFRCLLSLVNSTGLKPVIDSTYPLDEAQAAQGRMEAGKQFGKIVLTCAS